MNLWETIFLFFGFQAFILSFLFFLKKKGDRLANSLLGIYTFLFGLNLLYNVLFWSRLLYTPDFAGLLFTNMLIWSLYGPILYLYVRRVIFLKNFHYKDLLHFIPFLFFLINLSGFFILTPESKLQVLKANNLKEYTLLLSQYPIRIVNILMITYGLYILVVIRNSIKSRNISIWLKWLVCSYLGYVIAFTTYFIFQRIGLIEVGYDYFVGYTMIFFVAMMSYFGFLQPDVFKGLSVDKIIPFKKYQKTGLTETHSIELKFKLLQFMQSEKPFLDSEIRLDDLANKLKLSRHHMSQVINEHFDQSFFDFINRYRIDEAKTLLDDDNLNISDVLYSCGFNNRVSFYKAFKKFTGTTPTDYRDQINKAS